MYYNDSVENNILLSDDHIPKKIYMIAKGNILCCKNGQVVKKLSEGDYFGEIALFVHMESYFNISFEDEATIYELPYRSILKIVGDNYIKDIIYSMFIGAVKRCGELSKHLNKDSLFAFFNLFNLKYYFKDEVTTFLNKKICVVVSGRLMKKENFEIVAGPSDLFGSLVVDEMEG